MLYKGQSQLNVIHHLCRPEEHKKPNNLICDFVVKSLVVRSMADAACGKELHSQILLADVAGRQTLDGKTE